MDPLVRQFQENHLHRGLQFNTGPLLTSLYADDIVLYIRKPQQNLEPLIRETIPFGLYSGLKINLSKSVVFPPHLQHPTMGLRVPAGLVHKTFRNPYPS